SSASSSSTSSSSASSSIASSSASAASSSSGSVGCDAGPGCGGEILWQRSIPMFVGAIVTDAASNIYVAGWSHVGDDFGEGVVLTEDGTWDVLKLGPDGHSIWVRAIPFTG